METVNWVAQLTASNCSDKLTVTVLSNAQPWRAVLNKKGKGKVGIQYLVDWEPELDDDGGVRKTWPPSWDPASFMSPDLGS